jgi:Protein of unknown function (DUF2971)
MAAPQGDTPKVEVRGSVDLAPLRMFLGSIGSAVGEDLILSPAVPLFHYTDLNGLLGILRSGDLWLSHCLYSNDEQEMAHGQRVVRQAVTDAIGQAVADPMRTAYLNELKTLIDKPSVEGVYICCFCRKGNLLSQWRGYGANGAGVSVQFDSGGFSEWTGADSQHGMMWFWRVTYKPDVQRKIIDRAIEHAYAANPGMLPQQMAQRAADAIQFFIPTFKSPDFAEEDEWRLIFTPEPNCAISPRFRVRGSMLLPYYSLRELAPHPVQPAPALPPTLPIQGITVGPSATKVLNLGSLRMLLDRSGYPGVPAEASQTSFRV